MRTTTSPVKRLHVFLDDFHPVFLLVLEDRAALTMARRLGALVFAQGIAHLSVFQELGSAEQWLASLVDPRR